MDKPLKIDFSKIPYSKDQADAPPSNTEDPEFKRVAEALRHATGSLADTSTLDFIAYLFMQEDCKAKGIMPYPWLSCDTELHQHYLTKAANAYVLWISMERGYQIRRSS